MNNELSQKRLYNLNKALKKCVISELYKKKYEGMPLEISELSEVEKFDVTYKEELRECAPFGSLCVDMKEVEEYHESFGTTGKSISTYLTKNDFRIWSEEINACDINFQNTDVVLVRFPYAISDPAHILQAAVKARGGTVIPMSIRTVISPHTRVIEFMLKLNVTVVGCIPLELIMLAETAKLMGYDPQKDFPYLRAFCTAGEVLSDIRKQQIEEIWGVPIYNMYGTTENGNIAATCKNGHLHVADDHFIVEALDPVTHKPVKKGEKGILTVSNISLEACPLIRYYTGDIVTINDSDECSCGHAGEIINHFGRYDDAIRLNGAVILTTELQDAILSNVKDYVSPFWMVCVNRNALLIKLEKTKDFVGFNTKECEQRISALLGCKCIIELLEHGEMFDRKKLLNVGPVIKPKYVVDYNSVSSYPATLNDLLRGYHTF